MRPYKVTEQKKLIPIVSNERIIDDVSNMIFEDMYAYHLDISPGEMRRSLTHVPITVVSILSHKYLIFATLNPFATKLNAYLGFKFEKLGLIRSFAIHFNYHCTR